MSADTRASGAIRTVTVAERRARLAVRHHLAPGERAGTVAGAVADMIALHGTDPASVYLAAWARTSRTDQAAIEHALYHERSLVRMLGMRRTVFVVPAALVPVIQAGCTDQIAERLRRQLTQVVQEAGVAPDAASWLREVGEAAVRVLAARGSATGAELAGAEPRLRTQIVAAADNPYGGAVNLTTRLLTMSPSAEGLIVRGRPRGGWTSTQFSWSVAPERAPLAAGRRPRSWSRRSGCPRFRPGAGFRPAVVDRLDRRAGQAGPRSAGDRGARARRCARHHARRRCGSAGRAGEHVGRTVAGAAARP